MMYKDLTKYQQKRFRLNSTCPICSSLIFDNESLVFYINKSGHRKFYNFYHEGCYYGQEATKSANSALTANATTSRNSAG